MKRLLAIFISILIPFLLYAQTISEKSLLKFDDLPNVDGYSLKLDEETGTYLYSDYDTLTKKTTVFSNKGNTGTYDFIDYYNSIFDGEGNYYTIAYNNLTDTTYIYFILKNGKELGTYESLNTSWKEKNGLIYFVCTENKKTYLTTYDMSSGKFTKAKAYDDIILCSFPPVIGEGEPVGEIGFTGDGKPYYIAKENNEEFLVIGTAEQKHYSDIDPYTFKQDSSGNFIYAAKSSGKFYNAGNTFIVKGETEYKKFDYIYPPINFDNTTGDPIYIAADSVKDATPQRIMNGNNEISKTYSGGIWNVAYTPGGKLYFVASEKKGNNKYFSSFLVLDGKEGKKYSSISVIKILPGDRPLYIANDLYGESVIVDGTKEIETDYPDIIDATYLPNGKLVYIDGYYGNYNKKIKDEFYFHIGETDKGPYDGFIIVDYQTSSYIKADKEGNYVYLANKILNINDYTTKQELNLNSKKIAEFDDIENIELYKGKVLYTASNLSNKANYTSKFRIYYDTKPVSPEYDSINDYKFDTTTGLVTFTGLKGKEFVKVEIQL